MAQKHPVYDVAVIGGGVVGAAITRELAKYQLKSILIEAEPDIGMGTSKASTAIWHTGYDAKPGTLECRLMRRSYTLMQSFVAEAGIPHELTGALLVAWSDDQLQALPGMVDKARQNGVSDIQTLTVDEVYHREPRLNQGALGGLFVPGESIICTYSLPLAYAMQAVMNGSGLSLHNRIKGVTRQEDGTILLHGEREDIGCRYAVNAAGLYSDEINAGFGYNGFTVTPRRGELIVFDKAARTMINHILLPVPSAKGKGVLISPTVYGNVMLGPTAEDLQDKTETGTSVDGLDFLQQKGRAIMPPILDQEITALYAGLRAATEHSDYQISMHREEHYLCVGGIRSTGVSASLGIAEYAAQLLAESGLALIPKADFKPVRMPYIGEKGQRPYQDEEMIMRNPDFGEVVCYCERVTKGEIEAACHSPIPAVALEGLKRRTRAMQGRCQGFNCHANIAALFAKNTGQSLAQVLGMEERHE